MKTLLKSIGDKVLNLNEMNTLLAETAQIVNDRPIGLKPNESVDSAYLSPNCLLLGRSSSKISSGPFHAADQCSDDTSSFKTRFMLVQAITEQFWKIWHKLYFPSLIIRQKWHSSKRNVAVGDVCIVKDSNALRGEWKLGIVTVCYPDSKGKVRNVELEVKPSQGGSGPYVSVAAVPIRRHVGNIVVLVPKEDGETEDDLDQSAGFGAGV